VTLLTVLYQIWGVCSSSCVGDAPRSPPPQLLTSLMHPSVPPHPPALPDPGCYILRPWAYAMWEVVQRWFDDNIKVGGGGGGGGVCRGSD
jgi:hypothetical protein